MPLLVLPNTISAGQTALASDVQGNFDAIRDVLNGGIDAVNIGSGAVTTSKIEDLAVTEAKIANGAVTVSKIGLGAVTESKIALGAVTANKLANQELISTSQLVDDAVTSDKIQNNQILYDHLASSTLTQLRNDTYPQTDGSEFKVYYVHLTTSGGPTFTVNYKPSDWTVTRVTEGQYRITPPLSSVLVKAIPIVTIASNSPADRITVYNDGTYISVLAQELEMDDNWYWIDTSFRLAVLTF